MGWAGCGEEVTDPTNAPMMFQKYMIHGALPLPYCRDGGEVVVGGGVY